jgi:hypothetical protein
VSKRDRRVLLRQWLRAVNEESRGLYKSKEKTPDTRDRLKELNDRRLELVIQIVDLDRKDRSTLC